MTVGRRIDEAVFRLRVAGYEPALIELCPPDFDRLEQEWRDRARHVVPADIVRQAKKGRGQILRYSGLQVVPLRDGAVSYVRASLTGGMGGLFGSRRSPLQPATI